MQTGPAAKDRGVGFETATWVLLFGLVFSQPLLRFVLAAFLDRGSAFVVVHTLPFVLQLLFCIAFLANRMKSEIRVFALPKEIWLITLIWVGASILSVAMSPFPILALTRQTIWFEAGIFLFLAYAFFLEYPEKRAHVLRLIWIGGLAFGFLILIFMYSISTGSLGDRPPLTPPGFGNLRHFGYYLVIVVVAGMVPVLTKGFRWNSLQGFAQFLGFVFILSLVAWAGGRAPYLALGAGFLFLLGMRKIQHPWRVAIFISAAVIAGGLLSLLYPLPNGGYGVIHLLGLDERGPLLSGEDPLNTLSTGRLVMWQMAGSAITERPLIGYGADLFPFVTGSLFSLHAQPHNFVMQFVLAWGLIGGGAMLSLVGYLGFKVFQATLARTAQIEAAGLAAASGVIALLVFGLVDGTLYHQVPLTLLLVFVAVAVSGGPAKSERVFKRQKPALAALAVIGLVLIAHGSSVFALRTPGIPDPESWRIKIIKSFPSSMWAVDAPLTMAAWADSWRRTDAENAKRLLRWSAARARNIEIRNLLLARVDYIEGNVPEAREKLETAMNSPRGYIFPLIERVRADYEPEGK